MKRSEDLLDSLLERWIAEPEADPAQPDVREREVALDVVREGTTDEEPRCRSRNVPHAQGAVCEAGDRLRELVHLNRFVVREEIPAADVPPLREMHQRPGAIMDVDR